MTLDLFGKHNKDIDLDCRTKCHPPDQLVPVARDPGVHQRFWNQRFTSLLLADHGLVSLWGRKTSTAGTKNSLCTKGPFTHHTWVLQFKLLSWRETICQMCQLMQTRVCTSCFLIKTTRTLVFSDICAKYVFSPLKQRPLYTCVAPSGTTEEMLVCIFGNPGDAIVCCLNYFTGSHSVICSEETAHQVFSDKSKWVGQLGNLAMGNLTGISRLQKCTAGNLGDAIVCPMLENWPKFQTKKTFSRWSLSSVWCIFRPWAKRRKLPRLY